MVNPNFGTFNRAGTVADQASFDVGLRAHMVRAVAVQRPEKRR